MLLLLIIITFVTIVDLYHVIHVSCDMHLDSSTSARVFAERTYSTADDDPHYEFTLRILITVVHGMYVSVG